MRLDATQYLCLRSLLNSLLNRGMASPVKTSNKDGSVLKSSPTNSSDYGSDGEIGEPFTTILCLTLIGRYFP